ncbi:MAG: cytochrome oxidase putative small subunit CydP [Rhizomicrobium sp.]|jgi:hypothetical protein
MTISWPARLVSPGPRRTVPDHRDSAPIFPWAVRRDVLILISIKLAALAAIYWLFFAPHERPEPRPVDIAAHILDR